MYGLTAKRTFLFVPQAVHDASPAKNVSAGSASAVGSNIQTQGTLLASHSWLRMTTGRRMGNGLVMELVVDFQTKADEADDA